jgi:hypothetical protein
MTIGYRPRVVLYSFEALSESARLGVIAHLVEALAQTNMAWLEERPHTPGLYDSGIRYVERGLGICGDDWRDIPACLAAGNGVCEDLSAWRIAELRVRHGIWANPLITSQKVGDTLIYHVRLELPDGSIEDPSVALGMKPY